ncbi:MAG: thioredoxin family protein [Anaerolineales bacterium]|nr:thioredoxin family protein [Anaerolineales bacterium]
MTQLLNDDITQQIREVFDGLKHPVHLMFFGSKSNCDYCDDTRQLVEEVAAISDLLSIDIYDMDADADLAAKYNVDKAPGLVIAAKEGEQITDFGVRLAGIPSGHEFTSLIQDIVLVSNRDSGLNPQTREFLKNLNKPVILQVFVTPTCPYCPRAVVLAHQMAMESPMIQAEMVEATEFPELSMRHNVSGVPQTTINDGKAHVVGAVPEGNLLAEIQRVLAG